MLWTRRRALQHLGALAASATCLTGCRSIPGASSEARFLAAVRDGDAPRVRTLLAASPALAHAKDPVGRSAFLLAHLNGHGAIAEALLERGLQLDLIESVVAEDWPRMEALIEGAPDQLNVAHPVGGSPLYAAALTGGLANWRLRRAGCRPDGAPAGGSGRTPARAALDAVDPNWALISLTDLCSNGADINAAQADASSVLHAAVQRRDERLVRLAVRMGADLDAHDAVGRTPLALAAAIGWGSGLDLLSNPAGLARDNRASRFAFDANRDPVAFPDRSDLSAELQHQVAGRSHGRLEGVRELAGADPRLSFSISFDDEAAIEASAHVGRPDVIRYHLDRGAPLSLPTAVALADAPAIEFWLRRDATLIHERGAHDFPLMWFALSSTDPLAVAERLHRAGADVDQESMDTTALHWCVKRGNLDLAAWLLERGADPEPVGYRWSRDGETPLQLARAADKPEFVALLSERGALR